MFWLPGFLLQLLNTKLSGVRERNSVIAHTKENAATNGCKRGIGFQSIGASTSGKRLLYQTYSTRARRCSTKGPPSEEASRIAGSECAERRDHRLCREQVRGRLLWKRRACANIIAHTLSAYVREKGSGAVLDTFWILFAEFRLHQGQVELTLANFAKSRKPAQHWPKPWF
jgi:hypothetical protein